MLVALLIANVGVWLWAQKRVTLDVVAEAPSPAGDSFVRLELLSERDERRGRKASSIVSDEQHAEARTAHSQITSVVKVGQALCWFLRWDQSAGVVSAGPAVDTAASLALIQSRLKVLSIPSELLTLGVERMPRYLVHLAPLPDRVQAVNRVKKLLLAGYDAFVFESGALKNGVSLGLYRQRDLAEQFRDSFDRSLGVPQVMPYEQLRKEVMLRLSIAAHQSLPGRVWLALVNEFPGLYRYKGYCEGVVPSTQLD